MSKKLIAALFIHLIVVALVSLSSHYPIPSFSDSDWTTVLFLTPLGIISNFIKGDPALLSFYKDASRGNIALESKILWGICVSYGMLLVFAFIYLRLVRVKKN